MREVTINDLAQALDDGATVVDVREPGEYAEGHVPGVVHIPMGHLSARVEELGVVAIGGAAAGSLAAAWVPEPVLMASFAALLFVVGGVMVVRQFRHHTTTSPDTERGRRPGWDDPIITFSRRSPASAHAR